MKAGDLLSLLGIVDENTIVQIEVNGLLYMSNTCEISTGGGNKDLVIIHCISKQQRDQITASEMKEVIEEAIEKGKIKL